MSESCADCSNPLRAIRYRFGKILVCANCAVIRMRKGERAGVDVVREG